ncbi:Uncharacterised protein [Chryseobacterium gleum]|uniref:Phage Mu protein F like protein n=2 Tax=Chryseobacterium gleum TaxID=250 RepID=A0A448B802_CHRGE|nr:hypothetical protein [Chryseobacterium gleum]EFK36814.1 hypothetical protein HMPREF0204_11371 [Chryseobacterium gleum ATCC 35910]QQY32068.1 hypothetical protein I6I60_25105 [Chryseobacterium gleum]VEE10711.1 Uncharacterised protein [Chryseobacterium gleum]
MDFDRQHRKRVEQYLRRVEKLFNDLVESIVFSSLPATLKEGLFQFRKYPKITKYIENVFNQFNSDLRELITVSTAYSWNVGDLKNDALKLATLNSISGKIPADILNKLKEAPMPRNAEALKAFQERKTGKFTISDRVWSITQNTKKELEFALDLGLSEGKSAQQLAREIKKYLREPDRLYRRVRDKHGNLTLSKNAKAYKPGQGVYRSSMANAVRLTKEENNLAYRESDQLRIMQNNDIVGYRIELSNRHKIVDICDDLRGLYPKNFIWRGWHIGCMCQRFTVRKTDKEIIDEINKGLNLPPERSENYISDVPEQFKTYMDENKAKMEGWKTQPSFMMDNKGYIK